MKLTGYLISGAMIGLAGCASTPRFVYGYNLSTAPSPDPVINYVLLDNNDRGLLVAPMDTSTLPDGRMSAVYMSPDARLVAMEYRELTSVEEALVQIYDLASQQAIFGFTDNNLITELETFCLTTPAFEDGQAVVAADIAAGAFPSTAIAELVFFGSSPNNAVSFDGWTGDDSFRAIASVVTGFDIVDSSTGSVFVDAGQTALEDLTLHFERTTTGFDVTQCEGSLPAIIPPAPVRDMEISASGELLLDGAEIEDSTAPGTPLETNPVEVLSGPWSL